MRIEYACKKYFFLRRHRTDFLLRLNEYQSDVYDMEHFLKYKFNAAYLHVCINRIFGE